MNVPNSTGKSIVRWLTLSCLAALLAPATSQASRPREPLTPGLYSFDRPSPTVIDVTTIGAADVLVYPGPAVTLFGADLGLVSPQDELDALSTSNRGVDVNMGFVLVFSVDRETIGLDPGSGDLTSNGIPYHVFDQATKGQAAGDQYMSLVLLTRLGPMRSPSGRQGEANRLTRNNFNEGGTGYTAKPYTSAEKDALGLAQDCVDAIAEVTPFNSNGTRSDGWLYFSVTNDSPSLDLLNTSGPPSGADIFLYRPELNGDVDVYVSASDLGLLAGDEVDAVLVFDDGIPGVFDDMDQVLFSLAPDSPSLTLIPGASNDGAAADIFSVSANSAPFVGPFMLAHDLGLGVPDDPPRTDNVDALDFFECDDPFVCALLHGIRRPFPCDWDHDADVDLADFTWFAECLGGADSPPGAMGQQVTPEDCVFVFDGDEDGDVDLADFSQFQDLFLTVY